jgi:hypothetical protein
MEREGRRQSATVGAGRVPFRARDSHGGRGRLQLRRPRRQPGQGRQQVPGAPSLSALAAARALLASDGVSGFWSGGER